jgi:hypothetical protein
MKCDKCGYSDNGSGDWAHACGPVAIQRAPVMNSRIQELVKQAEEEIKAEYEDESRRNRRLYNEIFLPKFAELIVRECVGIADEYDGVGSTIVSRIKKHFGVEDRAVPILSDDEQALFAGIASSKLFTIAGAKKQFGVKE